MRDFVFLVWLKNAAILNQILRVFLVQLKIKRLMG